MKEHTVAKVNELGEGARKLVIVDGTELLLLNHGGSYYAMANVCPHENNPLCDGEVRDCTITCPTHEWTFSLKSGEADEHPGFELEMYAVRVDGAEIKITI
jgi:nitrite reductase/ring-hydroxylating ferredoxin subunit